MRIEKISVVVPVYNVEPYLRRCIDSLVKQTYPNLEIILVDDGSKDNCGAICDEYAKQYANIMVIHQVNAGLSVARNVGLEAASGEWIAFLDSDDWVESNMYETLLTLAQTYEADLTSCSTRQLTADGKILSLSDTGAVHVLTQDEMIAGLETQKIVRFEVWNKLWKRSLIGDVRFVEGQVSEDVHFDRLLFLEANKMVHVDLPLHNYLVKRPGGTASSFKLARLCIFDEFDSLIYDLEQVNKYVLADTVRLIAANFAYGIYNEAVDTAQNLEVKSKLLQLFKRYYVGRRNKHVPFAKRDIKMFLFYISPGFVLHLRKLKKMLL